MLLPIMMAAAQAATGYVRDNDGAFLSGSDTGASCVVTLDFETDGTITRSSSQTVLTDTFKNWYSRSPLTGIGADYDIQGTVNSGSASGPAGWNSLSAQRTWQVIDSSTAGGPVTANITFEIRDAATLVVVATGTIDISALNTL